MSAEAMLSRTANHCLVRRRAFTLVELTIVVLIISIVSVVAIPRYLHTVDVYRVELATSRLVSDLKYASTRARVTSTVIKIEFQEDDNPVESYYEFVDVADPFSAAATYRVDLLREPYGVIFTSAPNDIEFDIYGMPNHDRLWIIQHRSDPTVGSKISISEATGEIKVL